MTFGSLFSGIGGMDLGLERAGMVCKWQVEIDPFCQKVLEKHWPHVPKYGDIRQVTDLEQVDCIAGGFPCQDVSQAGARIGIEGERSGLFREYTRIIRVLRPRFVLMENVSGLLLGGLGAVLSDLDDCGYDAEWQMLHACSFGAPHPRARVFILAYPNGLRLEGKGVSGKNGGMLEGPILRTPTASPTQIRSGVWESCDPRTLGVANGGSNPALRNWKPRVKAMGNSVVPQVAEWVGRQIVEFARSYDRPVF